MQWKSAVGLKCFHLALTRPILRTIRLSSQSALKTSSTVATSSMEVAVQLRQYWRFRSLGISSVADKRSDRDQWYHEAGKWHISFWNCEQVKACYPRCDRLCFDDKTRAVCTIMVETIYCKNSSVEFKLPSPIQCCLCALMASLVTATFQIQHWIHRGWGQGEVSLAHKDREGEGPGGRGLPIFCWKKYIKLVKYISKNEK